MTGVLKRGSRDSYATEARRLIVLVVVVALLAALWHGFRGMLVRQLAEASVGCRARDGLIRAALRQAGFDVSESDPLRTESLPRPGWIRWESPLETVTIHKGMTQVKRWQAVVLDGHFRYLGRLSVAGAGLAMDIDGDDCWEVCVCTSATGGVTGMSNRNYAVLRMRPTYNELIWLGWLSENSRSPLLARLVQPTWQDLDEDGTQELVFTAKMLATRSSAGKNAVQVPQVVASFRLDRPGGIMVPLRLPEDCGITAWQPPDDAPVKLEPLADLDAVFRELMAAPAGPRQ